VAWKFDFVQQPVPSGPRRTADLAVDAQNPGTCSGETRAAAKYELPSIWLQENKMTVHLMQSQEPLPNLVWQSPVHLLEIPYLDQGL